MKKFLAIILTIVMVFGLTACGDDNSDKLIMGTSADYAPFEFQYKNDKGNMEYAGIDVFTAQGIADKMGKELQVENMGFDFLITELCNGNYDMVLAAMEASEERLAQVDFSDPYYTDYPAMILVKAENVNKYSKLEDFNGLSVGAQLGTTKLDIVKNDMSGANAVALELVTDLVNELAYGNVEALVLDGSVALQYAAADSQFAVSKISLGEECSYCVAVQKGDPKKILPGINKAIGELKAEGKIEEFIDKAEGLLGVAIEWAPYEEGDVLEAQ